MDRLDSHLNKLVKNTDPALEMVLVSQLHDFVSSHHTPLNIQISHKEHLIPLDEIDKYSSSTLVVTITANDTEEQWQPLDNQNIYILLRE